MNSVKDTKMQNTYLCHIKRPNYVKNSVCKCWFLSSTVKIKRKEPRAVNASQYNNRPWHYTVVVGFLDSEVGILKFWLQMEQIINIFKQIKKCHSQHGGDNDVGSGLSNSIFYAQVTLWQSLLILQRFGAVRNVFISRLHSMWMFPF